MDDLDYKSFIKKRLLDDEADFISKSNYTASNVWDKIETNKKSKKIIPIWLPYVAASIVLILLFNFWNINTIKNKNIEISELKNKIKEIKNNESNNVIKYVSEKIIDTIFVEKQIVKYLTKVEYDTIMQKEIVVKKDVKTIHDTIYIQEYIINEENDIDENIVLNDSLEDQNNLLFSQIKNYRNSLKRKGKEKISFKLFKSSNKKEELYTDNSFKITLK